MKEINQLCCFVVFALGGVSFALFHSGHRNLCVIPIIFPLIAIELIDRRL